MENSWHVATAAEAFAAAQFARCGWDVSVQYGANQPEYDLTIKKGGKAINQDIKILLVSVKGSKDGSWGLTQSLLPKNKKDSRTGKIPTPDYHAAVDKWLSKHSNRTIFCLVQFKGTSISDMPRMYLATPADIGKRLKESAGGRGETILYENHTWTDKAAGAGTTDNIPNSWIFSKERIEELYINLG